MAMKMQMWYTNLALATLESSGELISDFFMANYPCLANFMSLGHIRYSDFALATMASSDNFLIGFFMANQSDKYFLGACLIVLAF